MMILAFACPALFGIPMATAVMAKGQGRNPVLWFFLAYLLPVVSTLSLFFLKDKSQPEPVLAEN